MRGSRRRRSIYRREYEKPTDANILRLLMPSILGMLLCMVCLAGMTWAWFTDTSDVATATIQAAKFEVDVTFEGGEATKDGDSYKIEPEKKYTVILKAPKELKNKVYCKIVIGEGSYVTEGIEPGETFKFTACSSNEHIRVISGWKSFEGGDAISKGDHIGKMLPSNEENTENEGEEQQIQPETPKQDEQGHQTEAKAEQPKQPEKTDNTNSNDTKDSGSTGNNENTNDSAESGSSNASGDSNTSGNPAENAELNTGNSGDSADSNNSNSGDSSHADAGSSGTADPGVSHANDDNTAIS